MRRYAGEVVISRPAYLGGGDWRVSKLTALTVLFGKNGSGKSLMLRTWRDADVSSSHYVVPERSGDLGYNPNYLQQQLDAQNRKNVSSRNFLSEYRQQVISRIQAYFIARGASRGDQLPGDPAGLEQLLARLMPDFAVELTGTGAPLRLLRGDGQVVDNIDKLSSGEAQIVTVALDILTVAAIWDIEGNDKRLMLVDEPDAHVHPDLQVRFADFLVDAAKRYELQVVVATHSTTLLSALGQFGAAEASVVYLDRTRSDFAAVPFDAARRQVAACLGGHALMGPLFGAPLLLVEGDDDYRIWSQVPRHHVTSFAAVPCNGEEIYQYQRSLESVFQSLCETRAKPIGWALLDGDKALPDPSTVRQTFVRYCRLGCHEAENLYLADELLQMLGLAWADAAAKISAAAARFGNKAAILQMAPTWDRRVCDIKAAINEIALILDPKNVHWTMRVGAAIGRAKPTGQLADFLGPDVLAALWE